MKKLDILFEAFLKYRSFTSNNTSLSNDRSLVKGNNEEQDLFKVKKFKVIIHDDWLNEIEENLIYIEKALDEERQFIRTNSEVVEIEKVKRISKDSIVDLAKHSEYITKEPEDGNVIPDKILMVEKLSDFAVYENRFLYMLIIFIKNFIDFRLDKIQKIIKSYESNFRLSKEVKQSERTFNFKLEFNDYRSNNNYPLKDEDTLNKITRLNNIQEILESYLKRQIMVDVSKTPMVKAPITKTNILKNNNNFKRALALYEYLASYFDDGYSIDPIEYDFAPFDSILGDSFAEIYSLTNYLCYSYGNNLQETLKNNYNLKLAREKEELEEKLLKQIERLKKEIELEGLEPHEYMLMLERRMQILDDKLTDYHKAIHEKQELIAKNQELSQVIFDLESKVEQIRNESLDKEKEYNANLIKLGEEHKDELLRLEEEYNEKYANMNLDSDNLKEEIRSLNADRISYRNSLLDQFNEDKFKLESEYQAMKSSLDAHEAEINLELEETNAKLREVNAMHLAYLVAEHKVTGEYTSREKFTELENVFLEFSKFFKANFEMTKKEIKKELFWYDKQQDL